MITFVALALQMGHESKDTLHDCWPRLKTATQSVLRRDHDARQIFTYCDFLHFADNSQGADEGGEYDRLWKLTTVFDTLNVAYGKLYNSSGHLAVDEVIVKFKGSVIFRQYIQRKEKSRHQNLQTL